MKDINMEEHMKQLEEYRKKDKRINIIAIIVLAIAIVVYSIAVIVNIKENQMTLLVANASILVISIIHIIVRIKNYIVEK